MDPFLRTRWLIGTEAVDRLQQKRVAVFGVGGVGGFCIEALARAGVGALDIVDYDRVDVTNINRQIIATTETIGALKVDVMKERLASIVPETAVRTYPIMYNEENAGEINFGDYDYVVDAVDQVTAKLLIIEKAQAAGVPVLSAMGAGNKLHPEALELAMLSETKVCPLARVMRREAGARRFSRGLFHGGTEEGGRHRRAFPGEYFIRAVNGGFDCGIEGHQRFSPRVERGSCC